MKSDALEFGLRDVLGRIYEWYADYPRVHDAVFRELDFDLRAPSPV